MADITVNLRTLWMGTRVLGSKIGANMNVTTDTAITINSTLYRLTQILITNSAVSLTTAAGGIYTAASKGGSAIVSAAQTYSALTGTASQFLILTLAAPATTDLLTQATLYLSLTTAQGSAATADFYIMGESYAG